MLIWASDQKMSLHRFYLCWELKNEVSSYQYVERASYAKGNIGAKDLRLKEVTCMCTRNWRVISPRVQNEGLLSSFIPSAFSISILISLLPNCPRWKIRVAFNFSWPLHPTSNQLTSPIGLDSLSLSSLFHSSS